MGENKLVHPVKPRCRFSGKLPADLEQAGRVVSPPGTPSLPERWLLILDDSPGRSLDLPIRKHVVT
jgi:hypothetical protein